MQTADSLHIRHQAAPGIFCFLLLILSVPLWAAPPEGYRFLDYDDALSEARKQNKPVFLYFGRYGCSSCRRMHSEVFSDENVKQRYNDHYVLAYVDTESGDRIALTSGERITEMQFASRLRILGTPTFFFVSPDETPLLRTAGFKSIEQMDNFDEFIYGGHYRSQSFNDFSASK